MEQITQNTKISASDINTLISELNGKLNLSGGKITGCLFLNNPNYSYLCARTTNDSDVIVCGGSNMSSGSTLRVCGIERSSLAGTFVLTATDGTNNKQLIGYPNGSLTWGSDNVITSRYMQNGSVSVISNYRNNELGSEIFLFCRSSDSTIGHKNLHGRILLRTWNEEGNYKDFYFLPDGRATFDGSVVCTESIGTAQKAKTLSQTLPISLGGTGVTTKTSSPFIGLYDRNEVGTSVNMDNPGFNGFFEMRSNSEVSYTGTKPYDSFGPFITINHTNCALQIGGTYANGYFIRGKQMANPTLSGVEWSRLATFNTSQRLVYPNGTQMWIA